VYKRQGIDCECDECNYPVRVGGEVYCDDCYTILKDKIEALEEQIVKLENEIRTFNERNE